MARWSIGFEFPARRGSPLVDAADRSLAHLAAQRCATRGLVVGAAQAAQAVIEFDGQTPWNRSAFVFELMNRKVHAEAGAAGTTAL